MQNRVQGSAGLAQMVHLVGKYSKSLNITGSSGDRERWEHAGEAVLAVLAVEFALGRPLSSDDRWLDVGSGGGFPGLVVAAVVDAALVLVEPREKRAAFLEVGMGRLGRRGCVHRGRLEASGWSGRHASRISAMGRFDVVGARAVFDPETWCARAGLVVQSEGLTVLHLHRGRALPEGFVVAGEANWKDWRVVAGRMQR